MKSAAAYAYKFDDTAPVSTATKLRLVKCAGNAANDNTYNPRNQLTQVADNLNPANDAVYSFDPNGNQTRKTQAATQTDYTYDVKDQLLSVSQNTANLGVFSYDYQGHRIVKDMGGSTVRYAYDGNSVLLETDNTGTTLAKFDYGPDRLLSMTHASEGRAYYLFDALGSVANLTNTAGGNKPATSTMPGATTAARPGRASTASASPGMRRTTKPTCITSRQGTTTRIRGGS